MDSNPYWNQDFFGTIFLLLKRALLWLFGFIPTESLVEDDVAFIALAGIGTASVLSGLFLVVKRMTLLINSLSHTILLGIVVTGLIFVSFGLSPFSTVGFFVAAVLTALLTMFSTHVLIGIGEAVITVLTVSAIMATRSDLVYGWRASQVKLEVRNT